ncbi:MAG: hypothetical protein WBM43_05325 [Flavobacteriaceae bacterium]
MRKKVSYDKWSTEQLNRQVKSLRFATGLLGGILLLLFALTINNSIKKGQIDPLLISPIALSVIIPINIKKMREIKKEIHRREAEQ